MSGRGGVQDQTYSSNGCPLRLALSALRTFFLKFPNKRHSKKFLPRNGRRQDRRPRTSPELTLKGCFAKREGLATSTARKASPSAGEAVRSVRRKINQGGSGYSA
ncbi:unnamed protein product, partial [Nesidiocoris tenuis]